MGPLGSVAGGGELGGLRDRLDGLCRRHLSSEGAELLVSLARPAIRLHHGQTNGRSHLGGAAWLADPALWPKWTDRPLSLVAVLDLEELGAFRSDVVLPSRGVLNFFYDCKEQPWGFRPEHRGAWRVVLADPATAGAVEPPPGVAAFPFIGLCPSQTLTIPGWEEPVVEPVHPPFHNRRRKAERARAAFSAVADAWDAVTGFRSPPNHQVGGWPYLQQAPIWHECDLVSRGHPLGTAEECRRAGAHQDPDRERDWRLLLQLDTDDDAGWMWGDVGTIYFSVRPPPASYDDAWLTLQCG